MKNVFERQIFGTISGRKERGVIDGENETRARNHITNTSLTAAISTKCDRPSLQRPPFLVFVLVTRYSDLFELLFGHYDIQLFLRTNPGGIPEPMTIHTPMLRRFGG